MPARGGASGKAGDQYEVLWAVDAALRVVEGRAEHVTYESLDPEESRGVEFTVRTSTGDVEFWSIKRQTTTASGWTLPTLVKTCESGRSILGDLITHVERDPRNVAVFASTLGAPTLDELRAAAGTAEVLEQRLQQSKKLKQYYDSDLLPQFHDDRERARQFLTRLQIRTADATSLRTTLESTIARLFYAEQGGAVDTGAVRRLLAEYLLDHMHKKIDRKMLLDQLATHGFRRKDWKLDTPVREKVDALCDAYTRPLREQLIGGMLQSLPGAETLLGDDNLPIARRTLLSGGAGSGKSSELAHVIERLRAAGIPALPIRIDAIDESVLTPGRLGEALSLPASPVKVLAGLADGDDCVLVVDQLDAVSLASGRRTAVWSLFEQILSEANGYPNLRVVVACRAFDLEHDHRMRSLKAKTSVFQVVTIGSFDPRVVDEILGDRKVHSRMKALLTVPLHLAMYLSLERGESERLETHDQLFAEFWKEKQRRCDRRLGRTCQFAGVVEWLAQWLSERQELSAPAGMLPDEMWGDADAMASEHVILLAEGRYRFFHETFFDYAFARRFAQTGKRLLDLLQSSEQHLFRRAQVRQVLSFLRSNDPVRYLKELESVLTDDRIRFHIKRVVLQLLSAIAGPTQAEWEVLRALEAADPRWVDHVNRVVSNHAGWFDRLDEAGLLESELSSGEPRREERIVWLLAMPEILKDRSARVAALLLKHRRDDDAWRRYLQYVCRTGHVFHGCELFELFLSLIRDGTLDGTRPGFAMNDNWWSTVYSMGEKAPAMAAEAIAAWLDRKLDVWNSNHSAPSAADQELEASEDAGQEVPTEQSEPAACLWQHLDKDGDDHEIMARAADRAPMVYAEQLLPRVANLVAMHARPRRDRLDDDPLWSSLSFGDDHHLVHDTLFKSLARALETLARSAPNDLDRLLDPFVERPQHAVAYLILRAWTVAPSTHGERLARYLVADPRRLKVGYSCCGGGSSGAGVASGYRSIEAVRAASRACSPEAFTALENIIVSLRDEYESRNPPWRGVLQLQLLAAMDQERLGTVGRAKLAELRAKFPDVTHEPPRPMQVVSVGSPIPAGAQEKMSDDQWMSAMSKYADIEHRRSRDFAVTGGEHELAQSLESKARVGRRCGQGRCSTSAHGNPGDA